MLPLLRTKTTIPQARLKQIERPQLLAQIDGGMGNALTLIVAPAGFGKTTLAAAWARQAATPVAWLSLQPADRSPERFLIYLIQALQTIAPHLGQTTLALVQSGSPEGSLYALLNDLAELQSDLTLVLDDYHAADCPEVAEIVQFILDNRPPNLHLLITSRAAPLLSLTRLRAQGQTTEISTAQLRFSIAEIRDFLTGSMGLQVGWTEIDHLNQLTEGWAVGLQLASLAMARHPSDWSMPAGQAFIFDYLAEEVLQRETRQVQDFLKKTALFDRFCISLCESLFNDDPPALSTGATQLKETLAYIERANLFLVPLDAAGTWFRYHALFTDFLRRQLPPGQHMPLYSKASQWFEHNGLLEDAIHYAIHAADYKRAAGLLERNYIDIIQRGEQAALMEWIGEMPPTVLDQHPRLALATGWAHIISLNADEAIRCVERVEAGSQTDEIEDRLRGEAKALRILASIFAGKVAAVEEISSAFVLLSEQDDFLHCLLHFNLGLNYVMQGQTAQGVEAFTETLRLSAAMNNPLVTIVALVQMAETRQIRGALGLSERAFQQAIRYAKETLGEHTVLLGMPYISYSDLLREQNRFDEAIRYGQQGIAYCLRWQPIASMDGQISLARLKAAQGHWEEAHHILEQAAQVAEGSISVLDDTFVATHLVRLALLQGDITKADRLINAYELEKASADAYYHIWEMTQWVLLRARIARLADQPDAAPEIIETLSTHIAEAERRERVTSVIEALILRAYAEQVWAQNNPAKRSPQTYSPVGSLSKALTLGAQSGYVRILADEGLPLLKLLEQHQEQLYAPRSYVEQILQIMRREHAQPALVSPHPTASTAPHPDDSLIPLTRREIDILEHLAAGKSNQEIAVECTLALTTVKKHVANILLKLDVSNRTQAVALARKRGWIA